MPDLYPSRIQAFRDALIKELPRAPNTRDSRDALLALPTHRLILAFVTWRMRLIPAKPRFVRIWSGGVTQSEFQAAKPKLRPLLEKVSAGKDISPHLSTEVKTAGIILPGARPSDRRQDIDMVLTRQGLHHFHVGVGSSRNPKGRSGMLIFAEVLEKEFRIVAISDHGAFDPGSPEQFRFFRICQAYMAKDVPPGQPFMSNPVMASGHSMIVTMFADRCDDEMRRLDPLLDDPAFIDRLYGDQPISRNGQPVTRPPKPSMAWHFDDLKFGILDKRTMVFFCIFPLFAR
jgi:hypothetical protein